MIRATATISTVIWPRWASAERPVLRSAAKPTDVAELVEGSDKAGCLPDSEGDAYNDNCDAPAGERGRSAKIITTSSTIDGKPTFSVSDHQLSCAGER
jgi:hypothetical protein